MNFFLAIVALSGLFYVIRDYLGAYHAIQRGGFIPVLIAVFEPVVYTFLLYHFYDKFNINISNLITIFWNTIIDIINWGIGTLNHIVSLF
jgi:hypothetical protein